MPVRSLRTRATSPVAAFVLAAALVCAAWPAAAPATTLGWRTGGGDRPPLKVCTTGDYAPLTIFDPATGQYRGIDVDMAADLADHLGRAPVFVPTTWQSLTDDLTTPGRCDIAMGGISDTPKRRALAEVTAAYLTTGKTPLTRVGDVSRFSTVEQINQPGVRVIENPGGTNEQFARQRLPNAVLTIWPDNTTIFDQLAAGTSDVMITDAIEALYQSVKHPDLVAAHPDRPFTTDQKIYLLPRGSELAAPTNRWLTDALADGTFTRFYDAWMR